MPEKRNSQLSEMPMPFQRHATADMMIAHTPTMMCETRMRESGDACRRHQYRERIDERATNVRLDVDLVKIKC